MGEGLEQGLLTNVTTTPDIALDCNVTTVATADSGLTARRCWDFHDEVKSKCCHMSDGFEISALIYNS